MTEEGTEAQHAQSYTASFTRAFLGHTTVICLKIISSSSFTGMIHFKSDGPIHFDQSLSRPLKGYLVMECLFFYVAK